MNRSIVKLSIMLITLLVGGPVWADDAKIYMSSDSNPNFGAHVSAALDCGMPSLASNSQKKFDKMSTSRKARYNKSWSKKLKALVYKSFDHQYTRTEVNDMSEAELAGILRANPHMIGTMQNRPGRCSSGRRAAKAKKVEKVEEVAKTAEPFSVIEAYYNDLVKYEADLAAFNLKKQRKAALAAALKADDLAAKDLAAKQADASKNADTERKTALAKAEEKKRQTAADVKKAKAALEAGTEV